MDHNNANRDVIAISAAGAQATYADRTGSTITVATWYLPIGSGISIMPGETALISAHLSWSAALAGTLTVEMTNFPRFYNGAKYGPNDVTDYDGTTGNWIQWNPTAAAPSICQVVGTGNSATNFAITLGGTNAGGALIQIADCAFRRVRLKLVATAGGTIRCCVNGKLGT